MRTSKTGGYAAIGVYRGKTEHNIGTLWRSAYILGAAYIFTVEKKYKKQVSDVLNTWSRIPLFHYPTFEDLLDSGLDKKLSKIQGIRNLINFYFMCKKNRLMNFK